MFVNPRLPGPGKPVLFLLCLLPLAWLVYGAVRGHLGANPVETITHATGDWSLRLLLVTLAMTPLRNWSGWTWPIRVRRMLGLFAFFYVCLHFSTWLVFDHALDLADMAADIVKRPYITVGFSAFVLLMPLAATSNAFSQKRLGRRWKQLHRLVYVIGTLGVLHYLWLVKADVREPAIYGLVLLALLAARHPFLQKRLRPLRGDRSAQG